MDLTSLVGVLEKLSLDLGCEESEHSCTTKKCQAPNIRAGRDKAPHQLK